MTYRRQAFTIIELLVVISIIALLIGILLPSLAGARDRARFIKWKGYSHGLRADTTVAAYFNFEEQDGTETHGSKQEKVLWNRAGGDPMEIARGEGNSDPEDRYAYFRHIGDAIDNPSNTTDETRYPQWDFVDCRWKGKGGLLFTPSDQGYLETNKWKAIGGGLERNVTAWIRVPTGVATAGNKFICSWGSGGPGDVFAPALSAGTNKFSLAVDTGRQEVGDALTDDTWHHVVIRLPTKDVTLSEVEFYIDGEGPFTGSTSPGSNLAPGGSDQTITTGNNKRFEIGKWAGSANFPGRIDELAVWKTPVTQSAVLDHYKVGKPRDRR